MRKNTKTRVNNHHQLKMLIIGWCLSGFGRTEIIQLIKVHSLVKISNADADDLLKQSKQMLERNTSVDLGQTINIHIGFYEKIFRFFDRLDHTQGVLRSMKGKERLLGLTDANKIIVSKHITVKLGNECVYNLGRLSIVEQNRYQELLGRVTVT